MNDKMTKIRVKISDHADRQKIYMTFNEGFIF